MEEIDKFFEDNSEKEALAKIIKELEGMEEGKSYVLMPLNPRGHVAIIDAEYEALKERIHMLKDRSKKVIIIGGTGGEICKPHRPFESMKAPKELSEYAITKNEYYKEYHEFIEPNPTIGERKDNKEMGIHGAENRKNRSLQLDKRAKNRANRKRKKRK